MNRRNGKIAAASALIGLFLCGTALAQDGDASPPDGPGMFGRRHGPPPPFGALHLVCKAFHENMTIEVLTELTEESAETVKAVVEERRVPEFLEEHSIDPEAFRSALLAKAETWVSRAVACGLVTEEQAAQIKQAMARPAGGRRCMGRM